MMSRIDHLSVLAITSFLTAALGVFVLFKRETKYHLIFGLYSLSIAWFSFCQMMMIWELDPFRSVWWSRTEQIGVAFIPTLFIHFVLLFLDKRLTPWLLQILYGISFSLAWLSPTTDWIILYTPWRFHRLYFGTGGYLYPFVILYFVACTVFGLWMLTNAYRRASVIEKNRLKYLLFGSIGGYGGGALNYLMVYGIQAYPLNPFGTLMIPVYAALVAYAIFKHRLFDIAIIIRRTLVYSTVTASLTAVFMGTSLGMRQWSVAWGMGTLLPMAISAVLITLLYQPLRGWISTVVDRLFFRKQYVREERLRRLSREVLAVLKKDELVEKVLEGVGAAWEPKSATVFLREMGPSEPDFVAKRWLGEERGAVRVPFSSALVQRFRKTPKMIDLESTPRHPEAGWTEAKKELELWEGLVAFPLLLRGAFFGSAQDTLLGFLVIGDKVTEEAYSPNDLNLLEILANQAAVAFHNAELYTKLKIELMRLQTILSGVSEGIVLLDRDERIRTFNYAAKELLGLPPDALGQPLAALTAGFERQEPPPGTARGQGAMLEIFDWVRFTPKKLVLLAKEAKVLSHAGNPEGPALSRVEGYVLLLRDVTFERSERGVRQTTIAMMSHKLRTPVTVMIGYGAMLLTRMKGTFPESARGAVAELMNRSEALKKVLADIFRELDDHRQTGAGRMIPESNP